MKVATTTRSVLLRFPMGEVVERAPHGRFDAFYDEGIVFLSFYGTERPRAAFLFLVWDNSVFFSLPPSFRGRFSKTKTRQRQDKTKKEIKKTKKIFPASPRSLSLSLSVKFPSRSNVLFITRTRNAIKHAHARTHAHKYIAIPMNVLLTSTASSSVLVRAGTRRPLSSSSSSSSSSSRGYQKFTISNRYGKEQQQQQQASKVVANNAKKINSGMNNNNNKNMLFASGLGASIVGLLTPSAAMAISITDPVFGDIQIWQFLVLTAGYWIGIEMYLDKKYDENTTPIMPTLKKKDEDEDE